MTPGDRFVIDEAITDVREGAYREVGLPSWMSQACHDYLKEQAAANGLIVEYSDEGVLSSRPILKRPPETKED